MLKKSVILILILCLSVILTFTGFGIWHAKSQTPSFDIGGYILQGEAEEVKQLSFNSGESYTNTLSGAIRFKDTDGREEMVSKESFVHFDDNSVMALSDGILLDFSDLSENFINNYYITAKLRISGTGGSYTAETTAGTMKFGEHLWKLSDSRYIIESSTLSVHISDEDVREASDYVQVTITDDQIVHILTPENLWMTISEDCYIETAGGVRIYPASQLIENGSYKLSLAKLSVTTNDAIVLTEDETRRQIVPELNIEAIDGADGENGVNGRTGQNGEAGQSGESGTDGKTGERGQSGSSGSSGSTGSSGSSGSNGASGANGVGGSGGKNGGNGTAGKDAVAESSVNSALPTMAITDWQVSATGLKGTIAVTDTGGFLVGISELTDFQTKYPGKVTITNVATGAKIACYEAVYDEAGGYSIPDTDTTAFDDFYTGAEDVYFSTNGDVLEPDTQYSLSVTAYYKATDQTSMVYSREFISRTFYTDSTGVCLAAGEETQEALTVTATLSADYKDTLANATVYLLTPAQNESFTTASISSTENYIASYPLDFADTLEAEAAFSELTANTSYVARVYVETTAGLKAITSQALELKTLKRVPTTETGAVPTANYNRVTGAFEVYRPVVTDTDGGAVSYTYTAYRLDNGSWVKESSRELDAFAAEPVEFHLQSGETYQFGVELKFDDNEKTVYYDLGRSTAVKSEGDTMPKITLTPEEYGVDFNKYKGSLSISLGASSSMTVDTNHPLRLEIYADQIQNESVTLTDGNPVSDKDGNRYTITINTSDLTTITNQLDVSLELKNLYKNTNYSITVYGYLNVGDGNGEVSRAIGTVSFRTYDTLTLNAAWSTTDNSSSSISRTLLLSVQDSKATAIRSDYAIEELKDGQVTVELFSGTGVGKLRIAQKNFNDSDELNSLFTSGLEITEDDFGSPQLSASGSYTLTVSAVTDRTYSMTELGYVNTFESVLNASQAVVAEPTPPDLLADSAQGVKATPIYNTNAATYGGSVDDTLPDDAIVGYLLEASYDNVQRIGKTITYYAFEYNTFFNALASQDPLLVDDAPLMKMDIGIDSGSDTVPKVALLFGGTKSDTGTYINGYYSYFAGEANQPGGSLLSGMDRGYRYIFAYTVEYSSGSSGEAETTKIYPYGHREYDSYNKLYGGVKENGIRIGNNVAYILNSGMCEAPAVMPDFHTYVYSSDQDELASASATTATGSVTIHYTWRDPDKLINTDNTDNNTNIFCDNSGSNEPMKQKIQQDAVADASGWYSAKIPYVLAKGSDTALAPAADITEYKVDYSNMLSRFNLEADSDSYELCKVPLEWSWGKQFTASGYEDIMLTMTPNYEENYIGFRFDESDAAASALIQRAVAMRLTFQTTGGENKKTLLVPMSSEAGNKYVKLATGLLGTEYLSKNFEVTEATMFYDTGVLGWNILEQQGAYFAMQYKNSSNAPEEFLPSNYIGATTLENVPANGALLSLGSSVSFSASRLRSVIGSDSSNDTKLTLYLYNQVTTANVYARYLYPTRMGVDAGNGANVSILSGQYLVPKQLAGYSLKFPSGGNTSNLSSMTPTIDKPSFGVSSSEIAIGSIKVSGLPESGGTICVAAYTDRDSAEKLSDGWTTYKEIPIGSNGKPTGEGSIILTDLTGMTKYYLAFFYVKDGKNVLLLNSKDAQTAIYDVTTSDYAVINVTKIEYNNDSYFDKAIEADFTINRIFNLSLSYDIYASEEDAVNGRTPVLSNDEMDTGDENAILNAPTTVAYQNHMSINLMPSAARSKLKPGTTYWLKISASESNGTDAGSTVVPFTITAIGNYDALIYVSDATKDSITFNVTINDPQYTLMGRNGGSENGAALYAVRFTDEEGRVLKTSYDDEVYSAADLRKIFVLDDETLLNDKYGLTVNEQMQQNTPYYLNIYAVPDDDHDGFISLGGESLSWDSFFDKSASALKDCGSKFLEIINKFWNADTTSASSELEKQLLIATKQQNTLPESGWILNEDGIFTIRYNPTTLRVQFDESVGLLGVEPVFKQIDWYVSGRSIAGVPVNVSGQSVYSKGDTLLCYREGSDGYNGYYYDIPCELGQGVYTIVLQFRTQEGTEAPVRTITCRSGV